MAKDSAFIPTLKDGDFSLRPSQSYELNIVRLAIINLAIIHLIIVHLAIIHLAIIRLIIIRADILFAPSFSFISIMNKEAATS